MATSSISTKYRPVRIGFLIRDGEIEEIIKSVEINTILWGGIYNPIIPLSKDREFTKQLIKLFNVDILHPISNDSALIEFANEYEFLNSPNFHNRKIFHEDWNTKKQVSGYLDIINIVNYYWSKEFKNKTKSYRSNCVIVDWSKKDGLADLLSIIFGLLTKEKDYKYEYHSSYYRGLKAKKIRIKNNEKVNSKLIQNIYPLVLTRDRLNLYRKFKEFGVYVGLSNNYDDMINFWNLRASGMDIQFLPSDTNRLNDFLNQHLLEFDNLPNRSPNVDDLIFIYSQDSDDAKKTIEAL